MKQFIILTISGVLLCSCERTQDYYLRIKNNSERIICFHPDNNYPDDSILFRHVRFAPPLPQKVLPHSSNTFTHGSCGKVYSWYFDFDQSEYYNSGYVSFYLSEIPADVMEACEKGLPYAEWVDLPVIARYDLKREEIEALNWTVTYPPSEEMKGIHMWLAPETITDE